jgi:hypothetical protein
LPWVWLSHEGEGKKSEKRVKGERKQSDRRAEGEVKEREKRGLSQINLAVADRGFCEMTRRNVSTKLVPG